MGEKGVQQEEWFVTDAKSEDIFLLSAIRSRRLDRVERQEDLFMDTVGGGGDSLVCSGVALWCEGEL